jgi:O-antigen/teichoic acid export membrane protein
MGERPGPTETRSEWGEALGTVGRLAQGVSINLPVRFLGRALALGVQALLARLLGPEGFGRFAVGWNLLRLVEALGPVGIDKAVIRLTAGPSRDRGDVLLTAILAAIGCGSLIGLAFWALSPILASRIFNDPQLEVVFRWFAPGFGLAAGLIVTAAATRATQHMQYSAFGLDLALPAVNLLLVGVVYGLGVGLVGYVLAAVVSYLISLTLMLVFLNRLYPEMTRAASITARTLGRLLAIASPIWLASLATVLINRVDRVILPIFRPVELVGLYQAASQFSALFPIILSIFNLAYTPILAAGFKQRPTEELNALYRASTKWGIYLSLPAFVVLFVAPEPLLVGVYGPSFASGGHLLQVLMVGQLVNVCTGAGSLTLIMTGLERSLARISWIALLASLVLNVALIPPLGAVGAAVANSTAQIVLNGGALLRVRSALGLWPYDRTLAKGLWSAIIAAVVLAAFTLWEPVSPRLVLPASLGFVGLAYFGALLLQGLDANDRAFLKRVAQGIRR